MRPNRKAKSLYFFHGDRIRSNENRFYCAFCDSFEVENHFESCSNRTRQDHILRYQLSKKQFTPDDNWYRPTNTPNLFKHKRAKTKDGVFYVWLMEHVDDDSVIGDLARSVSMDDDFPRSISDYVTLRGYMLANTPQHAFQAFRYAYLIGFGRNSFEKPKREPITPRIRYDVFQRDNFTCKRCGRNPEEDGVKIEVDHIMPVVKGGETIMENLQTLCFDCNRGKADRYCA